MQLSVEVVLIGITWICIKAESKILVKAQSPVKGDRLNVLNDIRNFDVFPCSQHEERREIGIGVASALRAKFQSLCNRIAAQFQRLIQLPASA